MYGIFVSAMRTEKAPRLSKYSKGHSKSTTGKHKASRFLAIEDELKFFNISCNLHSSQSMKTPTTRATSSLAVLQFHELRHHRCFSQISTQYWNRRGIYAELWYFSDAISSNLGFSCLFNHYQINLYKKHKLKYLLLINYGIVAINSAFPGPLPRDTFSSKDSARLPPDEFCFKRFCSAPMGCFASTGKQDMLLK